MYKFVLAVLFFVLSPGVFLTLPARSKGIWMSGQTSVVAALVHALIFVIVYSILKEYMSFNEGFAVCNSTNCKKPKICNGSPKQCCTKSSVTTPEVKDATGKVITKAVTKTVYVDCVAT